MTTPDSLFAAQYRLGTAPPASLFAGEPTLLDVVLENRGLSPWLTVGLYPVLLGYRWLDGAGRLVAEGGFTPLPAAVPPGLGARVELRVAAPAEPGSYRLRVELLEYDQAWFSERGVAPLELDVAVQPDTAPRVAIINGNVVAHDAVGGHIVAQLLTLREAGYNALLITGFVDSRLPVEARRSMLTADPAELRRPDSRHPAAEHLRRADIVIVNYSVYYDLVEVIRDIRRGVVIFDYHGVTPPELWRPEWPGYSDLLRGRDNLGLVRYADYAVGHSQFTCDELIATGAIAPARVSLMPYAVVEDSGYAGPPDPAVVDRFGLAGRHVLLYVGRMARNKRVVDLVEALPAIVARHPDALLLLVGDDQFPAYRGYVAEVSRRAEELGVAASVRFTGQVDDATLEGLYRACTIFVTASIHEGFCMPVVEAMSRGRPVVAADSTAIPGTLGGAGLLFPPEDPAALAAQVSLLLDELPPPGDHSDPLAVHRLPPAGDADVAALRGARVAVVAPRYGPKVLGGAESGIRAWAEQLARRGYRVEALTTCTVDMADWRDHVAPGVEELNGVTVRRFSTAPVDAGQFHELLQQANRGRRLRYDEELRFMANNLRSHGLERFVAEHADDYACLIATPYLFGTSYWPAMLAAERAVLLPCLHDEPSARLVLFREMLERCAGILFNSEPESELASEALGVANPYRARIGYGFPDQPPAGDPAGLRARIGADGPLLLYSGRLEHAKNVPLLLEWFARYKAERPGPLTLVLAGSGDVPVPQRPDIVPLGMISDRQLLTDAYAAALALWQPSLNESFSIVIMESWLQGRPVIVHHDCAVTRDHVERSGGGFAPGSYAAFRDAMDDLLADPARADELGARGRDYVLANYAWGPLMDRMERTLAALTRPRSRYARLAQRGVVRALAFTRRRFQDELLGLVGRAAAERVSALDTARRELLRREAQVARPGYRVSSGVPVVGRAVAWVRRQLTSHLKEPYLDPMIASQERFNRELLEALIPALDESLREQRRLRAEIDLLRSRLEQPGRDGEG